MKTLLTGIAVVSILAVGALAFAHGPGGWGGGHMMAPGYGNHMMGAGYGGPMYGWRGTYGGDQKFLDETADLRKELHNKKFEYFEASRNPDTTNETLAELEKNIYDIQEKIRAKSPRAAFSGYGRCW